MRANTPWMHTRRRALLAVLCSVLLWGPPREARCAEGAFHPYVLRHAKAVDVEPSLARLLPQGTEILADQRGNRILVRGSQSTLQLAETAIQSLDQPKPATPAQVEPVLKSYPCPSGDVANAAAWLRNEVADARIRVASDPRTKQILVLAPAEMQPQIARLLSGAPNAAQPGPASTAAPRQTSHAANQQRIALQFIAPEQIAQALVESLGPRIAAVQGAPAGVSAFRVTAGEGEAIDIAIEHPTRQVAIQGSGALAESCERLVRALDAARGPAQDRSTQLVSLKTTRPADAQRAVAAIQTANQSRSAADETAPPAPQNPGARLAMLFQRPPEAGEPERPQAEARGPHADASGLVGPVQIEMLEGLDVLIVRGHQRDVDQVMQIIQQIERLSAETEPVIEIYTMQQADGEPIATLVNQIYSAIYSPRLGSVTITPLVKPNALLLIGRVENVRTAIELVRRLDQPVSPENQFRVFALRHASATQAATTVQELLSTRTGLSARARVTAEYRTNSLIVQASPRDMAEVEALVKSIDVPKSEAANDLRIFKLQNALATEMAAILQNAIAGQTTGQGAGQAGQRAGQQAAQPMAQQSPFSGMPGAGAPGQMPTQPGATTTSSQRTASDAKSLMLRFLTVDAKGQRLLSSGILSDVRVTADARANALVVSAPAESMELIGALINELDSHPATDAQLKVFTIVNADVLALVEMLQTLFGQTATRSGQGASGAQGGFPGMMGAMFQAAASTGAGTEESSLVPLRFAVDVRTNSIIVSGSAGDLNVVEAILLRLDETEVRHRKSIVYRLKNAPATSVAQSINQFLQTERQVQQLSPGLVSPFEQIEREVIVVPETVSNSLIVSATPRFFDEIQTLVEQLDKRPGMVMIQVLIAEVELSDYDEFGVELGLQDSILFDRSVLGDIQFQSTNTTPSSGVTTVTQQVISATNVPGYNFNNGSALGNSGSTQSLNSSNMVGGQSLTNFGVGRINNELGYGGLVLSASSESISVLLRALQQCQRLDILSRPQIMTLDNQAAFILVGERVPRITGSQVTTTGQVNNIQLENVGLILGVTPRISPDGLVVMEIDSEKSEVGDPDDGIPVSLLANGQVIKSPKIKTTQASTTVSALDGQTVILGGLMTKTKNQVQRRVPLLSQIPILGNLFRYDSTTVVRKELLIIMTPHIVQNENDMQAIKQTETARMSWCMADVQRIHGSLGVRDHGDEWQDGGVPVVYPDGAPTPAVEDEKGGLKAEPVPAPKPLSSSEKASRVAPPQTLHNAAQASPPNQLRLIPSDEARSVPQSMPQGFPAAPGLQPAAYQPTGPAAPASAAVYTAPYAAPAPYGSPPYGAPPYGAPPYAAPPPYAVPNPTPFTQPATQAPTYIEPVVPAGYQVTVPAMQGVQP